MNTTCLGQLLKVGRRPARQQHTRRFLPLLGKLVACLIWGDLSGEQDVRSQGITKVSAKMSAAQLVEDEGDYIKRTQAGEEEDTRWQR